MILDTSIINPQEYSCCFFFLFSLHQLEKKKVQWEDTLRQMRQHPGKTDFMPKIYLNTSYDNPKRDLLTLKIVDLKVYFDTECVQKI